MLANASDRLDEVDALTRQGDPDAADEARIARTLDTFTEQAIEASDLLLSDYANTGDASSIAQLRDFASSSLDQLAALEPLVPPEARDELIRAAGVLATIDAEAAQQCPTCGGTPITSIPPVLLAAEPIVVPASPRRAATERADDTGKPSGGKGDGKGDGPGLPDVDADDLGPGSVADPGRAPPSCPAADHRHRPDPATSSTASPAAAATPADAPSPSVPVAVRAARRRRPRSSRASSTRSPGRPSSRRLPRAP